MREKLIRFRTTLPCLLLLICGLAALPGAAFGNELVPVTTPAVSKPEMPKVFFPHDKHVDAVEARNGDCSTCHNMTDAGMSETLKDVTSVPAKKQVAYMHASCTDCHVKSGKGPRLVDCRVCHSERNASEFAGKKK